MRVSLVMGEEIWEVLRLEYADGVIRYTAQDVQQYCLIEKADQMVALYSMPLLKTEEGLAVLPLFEKINNLLQDPQTLLTTVAEKEQLDENRWFIRTEIQGIPVSLQAQWNEAEYVDAVFDWSSLESVPFSAREGFFGSSVMTAVSAKTLVKLMTYDTGFRKISELTAR